MTQKSNQQGSTSVTQYLILIYGPDTAGTSGHVEGDPLLAQHVAFQGANQPALLGGNALEPTATATSIRHDANGEVTVTDGPFAETKEALGGYYLIDAADLDEAIAIAKQVPAPNGGVEVRPIWALN
jgi:hypothetical protein